MSGATPNDSEPTFHDLMADPMIRAIMQSDGIDERELLELCDRVAGGGKPLHGLPCGAEVGIASEDPGLRRGVGVMLINPVGQVFVGRRNDVSGEAWQMPQGGIEPGEPFRAAALRELREELGTANVRVLAETSAWLSYEIPPELRTQIPPLRWRGQTQRWFLMQFRGTDDEIKIDTEHPEFSAWKWVPPQQLLELIVPFKRDLYERILGEFAPYLSHVPSNRTVS